MARRSAPAKKVPATEFAKNFGEYRDHAQREPVEVTNHGRATGYFISPDVFNELLLLRKLSRRAIRVVDLPKETIDAIRKARVPRKYNYLNALLDED